MTRQLYLILTEKSNKRFLSSRLKWSGAIRSERHLYKYLWLWHQLVKHTCLQLLFYFSIKHIMLEESFISVQCCAMSAMIWGELVKPGLFSSSSVFMKLWCPRLTFSIRKQIHRSSSYILFVIVINVIKFLLCF